MADVGWGEAMAGALQQSADRLAGAKPKPLQDYLKRKESQDEIKEGARKAAGGSVDTELYPSRSFKKGGRVPKTGVYKLHKGEFVVPARIAKRIGKGRKAGRKAGRR